jgi:regulator of protease activity HflC (stomatin/prohibitin superfamily)
MKIIKAISIIIIGAILGFWLVLHSLTVDIPIGQVGVRTQQYSLFGQQGLITKDYAPGWHRDLGPIDKWLLFDSTAQTLEMNREPGQGSDRSIDDIKVQSADGYAISLDVTVKYQIIKGKAYQLYQQIGAGTKYKIIVRNEAQKACMGAFGQMKTEDFYNPAARRTTAEQVHADLNIAMNPKGLEVIEVLIRSVQFDPEYEKKIRRKKLADQEVELNKSMGKAEEMSGKTQVIEAETAKLVNLVIKEKEAELIRRQAETDLEIAGIKAEYDRYVKEKKADADLIAAQKMAEGTLKVRQAEAEGERLRNEALQGSGGDMLVALEAARNLKIGDVDVSTLEIDFLDLDQMVKKLGASAP